MKKLITCLFALASAASLQAASVSITNHSFEDGAGAPTPGNWNNNTPDGWTSAGGHGMQSDVVNPSGIDGNVFGFLEGGATGDLTGGSFIQSISAVLPGGSVTIGDAFTLTLAALNQNGSPSFDFDIRDNADPSLGSSLIGGAVQSVAVSGAWADYVVLGTVATSSTDVFLILNTNGPQVRIDNVRLDLVVVPEPSSSALLGLGGLALILRRRR